MKKITYDDYDTLCLEMEDLAENTKSKPYFPSEKDLNKIEEDLDKYYKFIVFLDTTNPVPSTEAEKASAKRIRDIIQKHTEFIN